MTGVGASAGLAAGAGENPGPEPPRTPRPEFFSKAHFNNWGSNRGT
jgi:hypothetical protein